MYTEYLEISFSLVSFCRWFRFMFIVSKKLGVWGGRESCSHAKLDLPTKIVGGHLNCVTQLCQPHDL